MKIRLKINTAYGKVGDEVEVGPAVGQRLIDSDQAEQVSGGPEPQTTQKRRGRPPKIKLENKKVGA